MPDIPEPTQAHKALARTFYLENAAMNKAKKTSEAARKDLFAALELEGITDFAFGTTNEAGEALRLRVKVETPAAESIDVALLKGLVDEATFLKIVSASKKAVEEHADKAILPRVTVKEWGTRNVSVKPAA